MNKLPELQWLGRIDYKTYLQQLNKHSSREATKPFQEHLWACEHEPVLTTGKRGLDNRLAHCTLPLLQTDRGGETTYHGPGQLMLYPVLDLRARRLKLKDYVQCLEQSCIQLLAQYDVHATRRDGFPGVWIGQQKIAALGLRVSKAVVYHGMALNIHTDLRAFQSIVPCGLHTPITRLANHAQNIDSLKDIAARWRTCLAGVGVQ